MKIFIVLSLSTFAFSAFSYQLGAQGRKANYYYFELVPKEKFVVNFQSDKRCKGDTDKIRIDEFDSTATYPSNETKEMVSVRVKNIFVESFSICSNQPIGKLDKRIVIGPFDDQMTHIRVTTSNEIRVTLPRDCGLVPPGATFDKNCKVVPLPPPPGYQGP